MHHPVARSVWLNNLAMPHKGTGFGSKPMSALIERKWNGVVTFAEETTSESPWRFLSPLDPWSTLRGTCATYLFATTAISSAFSDRVPGEARPHWD